MNVGLWAIPSRAVGVLIAIALATGLMQAAVAQQYPARPVKFILPFGPGSGTDISARHIAEELRTELGETFLVENRPGANGFLAAEAVARATPDGYTLMLTASTTHSTNPYLFKKLPYDPVKDYVPVAGLTEGYYLLIVHKDMPVNTMQELIDWLKANPTKASYGWGATVSQITSATFLRRIGATATGVPYKSSPQAVTDLIGGQITFMFQDILSVLAQAQAGRMKVLATTSPVRLPTLPNVPLMAEAGMPNFHAAAYTGIFAPAGTPEPIVRRLNDAVVKIQKKPEFAKKLESCCAAYMLITTPKEFADYLDKDRAMWAERIAAAGIKPE